MCIIYGHCCCCRVWCSCLLCSSWRGYWSGALAHLRTPCPHMMTPMGGARPIDSYLSHVYVHSHEYMWMDRLCVSLSVLNTLLVWSEFALDNQGRKGREGGRRAWTSCPENFRGSQGSKGQVWKEFGLGSLNAPRIEH